MNRTALVTVATGGYVARQKRLIETFQRFSPGSHVFQWSDKFPPGSPAHAETPYGFKLHAIRHARSTGVTKIIWADAPIKFVRSVDSMWDKLNRDGHYFFHGEPLGRRISDECLEIMGMPREEAFTLNLIGGSVYGFDFECPRTSDFFDLWWASMQAGAFRGFAINSVNPVNRGALSGRPEGFVSNDMRVTGHNHDESAATIIAHRLGMKSEGPGESVFAIANIADVYPEPVCVVAGG